MSLSLDRKGTAGSFEQERPRFASEVNCKIERVQRNFSPFTRILPTCHTAPKRAPGLRSKSGRMLEPSRRTLSVSPRQLALLYHRCARCLYERVHLSDDLHVPGSTFRATALASIEAAQGPDGWIHIPGSEPVRILFHAVRPNSAPISFPVFGIDLVVAAHPTTVLQSKNGKTILSATRQREANATLRSVLRYSLEAATLAAEHPADPADVLPHIDELGIIEFSMKLQSAGEGTSERMFRPARLIRLQREPERFAMFMDEVARILAGPNPPPPSTDCPTCNDARAGDKVPA
jgi:hypothetical protein